MRTYLWLMVILTTLGAGWAGAQPTTAVSYRETSLKTAQPVARPLPRLTKAQYYADFDTLYQVLSRVNPHDFVRRTVNGYSMLDSIRALRSGIDTIQSAASFYGLVSRALTYCQDGHTATLSSRWYRFVDSTDQQRWQSTAQDTSFISAYSDLNRRQRDAYQLRLPIRYQQGDYHVWADFEYQQQRIPFGATLVACNGEPIHAYVRNLLSYAPDMHWDFGHKRFYTEAFTRSTNLPASGSVLLTFAYQGQTITHRFRLADTVNTSVPPKATGIPRRKTVTYLADQQIFYLRIPVMADGDYYLRQIDSLARRQPIRKIILDIRDNPGGSDLDWQNIIRHLIDKPIVRGIVTGANPANPRADRLDIRGPKQYLTRQFIPDSLYQVVSTEPDTLIPDTSSIQFTGKIYVLQNENCFSSAGSLISTCQFSDQLINVGNSTGWFAGFGSMPWVMILPHSKILYWTEPLLDFTNVQRAEDLFHNQVKLPVDLTLEAFRARQMYPGDVYSLPFLVNYDPLFRTVLNQP